jgi:hypothetical protein
MTDMTSKPELTARQVKRQMRKRMLAEFWFYFSENRGAVIGLFVMLALVFIAVFAPFVAPHEPTQQYRDALLVPPVWQDGGSWKFILGTDAVGRDILSRLIFGARFSLFIGVVVVGLALLGGVSVGLIAGFFRGPVDTVIMRIMDVILAFPSLLLALVMVAILGPGLLNAMIAIAIVLQPHFVRLDDPDHSAELSGAGDRAGDAIVLECDSGCGRAWLPRDGSPAPDAGMGNHAGRGARIHSAGVVGRNLPRSGNPDHRSGDQPDG